MRESKVATRNDGSMYVIFAHDAGEALYCTTAEFKNYADYADTIDWVREIAEMKIKDKISCQNPC